MNLPLRVGLHITCWPQFNKEELPITRYLRFIIHQNIILLFIQFKKPTNLLWEGLIYGYS